VLIEVPSQSSGHAVIGVGLNVNNSFANAPEQLAETGTSLADQSPTEYRRIEVLRTFMQEFESLLELFAATILRRARVPIVRKYTLTPCR